MGYYRIQEFSETAEQTSETLTIVGSAIILNSDFPWLTFTVTSSGGSVIALDEFEVQVQAAQDGSWVTAYSAWVYSADRIILAPTAIETLAHGSSAIAVGVFVGGVYAIRFLSAQAGSTGSAVTILVEGVANQNG